MFKAMITLERTRPADTTLGSVFDHLTPLLERAMLERYRPSGHAATEQSTFERRSSRWARHPRDLARLVETRTSRPDPDRSRHQAAGHFGDRLDNAIDRVTMGIMTASVVIGSLDRDDRAGRTRPCSALSLLTLFGLLGYVIAFADGLWIILLDIEQSSRR